MTHVHFIAVKSPPLLLQKVLPKSHGTALSRTASPVWYNSSSRPATPASAPTPSRLGPGPSALAVTLDPQEPSYGAGTVAGGAVLQQHRGIVSAPEHPWDRTYAAPDVPAAGLGIEPSVMVPWFAVTAELLGDVIRLAWHWHEVDRRREAAAAHAPDGTDGVQLSSTPSMQQQQQRLGGFPRDVAERLGVADWALCRLAQTMDQQVATGRQQGPAGAAVSQAGVQASHGSYSSLHNMGGAAGQVNMAASMDALAVRLLRPPPSVDELFVLMRERKEHVLTGGLILQALACSTVLYSALQRSTVQKLLRNGARVRTGARGHGQLMDDRKHSVPCGEGPHVHAQGLLGTDCFLHTNHVMMQYI